MEAKKALAELAPIIDKIVEENLQYEFKHSKHVSPFIKEMVQNIIPLAHGGKRLRGALTYYSYLMFGGTEKDKILKASAFVELIHIYILIMDDIIDQDDIRHKKETVHKIYQDYHAKHFKKKDSRHFGESMAICAGIILNHIAENILLHSGLDSDRIVKAMSEFNLGLAYTGYGEALDVLAEVKDTVTEYEAIQINLLKTAKYTYENPLYVGAILAGASEKDLKALSEYAIPAGIAYQIQDDILGMFGDAEKLGKPEDSDLKEGKQNLLTVRTIKMTHGKTKKRFLELLGNPNITKTELEEARKIIRECGALDYCKEKALNYVKSAESCLATNHIHWKPEGRAFLEGIADYMIKRDL